MGDGGVTVTLAPSHQHVLIMKKSEGNYDKNRGFDDKSSSRRKKSELDDLELGEFVPESNNNINSNSKWKKGKKWEFENSNSSKWEFDRNKNDRGLEKNNNMSRSKRIELEKGEFVPEREKFDHRNRKFGVEKGEFAMRKNTSFVKGSSYGDYEEEPGELKYEGSHGKGNWKNKHFENRGGWNAKVNSSGKFNHLPRHNELHSRLLHDKHKYHDPREHSPENFRHFDPRDRSPMHSERSPVDRNHYFDPRDRSPEKSPMDRNRHYDSRDRSPPHYERSPFDRGRHYDPRDHSPMHFERSPIDRGRHFDARDRSPGYHERSPLDKSRHYDPRDHSPAHWERSPIYKNRHYDSRDHSPTLSEKSPLYKNRLFDPKDRSPAYSERSPMDRGRNYDHRDRSPLERARHYDHKEWDPPERKKPIVHRDKIKKSVGNEKQHAHVSSSKYEGRRKKDSSKNGILKLPNTPVVTTTSIEKSGFIDTKSDKIFEDLVEPIELQPPPPPSPPPPPPPPDLPPPPLSPHPENNDSGMIGDMASMEEDMDICDTPPHDPPHDPIQVDRKPGKWFYIDYMGNEQGLSRLDDLKKLVEEGHLISDHMIKHSDSDRWQTVENAASPLVEMSVPSIVSDDVTEMVSPPEAQGNSLNDNVDLNVEFKSDLVDGDLGKNDEIVEDFVEELNLDKRVDALLDGFELVDGKELEVIGEALHATFVHADWENWDRSEGFTRFRAHKLAPNRHGAETETRPPSSFEEGVYLNMSTDWFAGKWSCMGGDWKRNDEFSQEKSLKKKIVLNHGYPLCQMPKCGNEDPRGHRRDDLYYPSSVRKLELPLWAFSIAEENCENGNETDKNIVTRQMKPPNPRGSKGTMLSVVRINACVVRDHGSEPHSKLKNERHIQRYTRSHSDRSSSQEGSSHSRMSSQLDLQNLHKCRTVLSIPRDHVCTVDELSLDLGDWYYLDGAAHEHGPYSYSDLQKLASRGIIMENSSVFRKLDNAWLPITCSKDAAVGSSEKSNSFHGFHPQFIGYTRGKLHELVMKSFKNREFAAAINEVLEPWISEKQTKKEMDRHFPFNTSITKSGDKLWKSDENYLTGKRPRYMCNGSDGDSDMEEVSPVDKKIDISFDNLCGEATFIDVNSSRNEAENENWGLLNGHILARIFHFIRADVKSIVSSSATCKRWNLASKFYRNLCTYVNFSSVGPGCSDLIFQNIMDGYEKNKLTSIILTGCSNITAQVLENTLHAFPCISLIDIQGCSQFNELIPKFQNVKWIKSNSYSRTKSLKANNEDSSNHPFRQGVYKRPKLFGARKSSEVMSRDAQRRRWLHRKTENRYRKMKEFIAVNLKDIMKENTSEYFIPKVAQIEDRMRNGYYIRHGLSSVKDDISRMCRDAMKSKNRCHSKETKHIVMLFIQLARRLEGNLMNERDEIMTIKDNSEPPRYKKKQSKVFDKKGVKSYGQSDLFDHEIKRSLFKLKKRDMDSSSETSDDDHDNDFWEGDDKIDGETTESDTESDLDIRSRDNKGNMYSMLDDSFDSVSDDREWGARMTKAGLVPPVTRKYEVIDNYLPIADEEEVKRKMRVALPDDYSEKLLAQKSGLEETEMEIPEVKEFKPRKSLGSEVLEQEVYGIDPYTHNLLLDSMPDDLDWPLVNKHKFIEEVLLRTLNRQVRRFTGSGNTPMIFHLCPVVEEIYKNAEVDGDRRSMKLCQAIIKAMQNRPADNYVAYRKGLGVVCNKEGGFGLDDFVVEFLGEVYPAWKWFEKQDGIRSLQKNNQDPAPEFYNIYLERPKGDRDGYDLVVVDAMHKANYASRICHSCRPNCEAKVTAVDGQYQIGIYTVRPIGYGEEITFDYNSVTESKEEYEASVCLCGSHICRGSYLNLTGEDAFQKVLEECHGVLDRHKLLLDACEANFVSEEDYIDLGKAGLGTCLLSGLPDWLVAYSAHLVRFINFERTKLPEAILKHNMEEKRKFFADVSLDDEKSDAEIQAEGVYNSRLQNMALTLDKVRYVMRRVFGDPKQAPPPIEKLSSSELVSVLWKGKGSVVEELLEYMSPHMDADMLNDLKSKIHAHDPSGFDYVNKDLRKSLLWLRDELRNLPCSSKCRHDAAADLIHIYAYTKSFYKVREYKNVTSPPVYISPLDLGPKYAEKMGPGFQEYCKTYGENYCLGQLIYWHSQTDADPDNRLSRARRGCLSLPDVSSFYVKHHKPVHELVYDSRTLRFMMNRMEKQPQRSWPKDRIWQFKNNQKFIGSPMLDSILNKSPLDKEMMQWLKSRRTIYNGMWDG